MIAVVAVVAASPRLLRVGRRRVVVAGPVGEQPGDDLVAVEVVKGAVEQPGQDVDADLVEGGRVPGAPGGVGQQVDPFDRGLGLGGGQAAGTEHGGAVLVQPGAHRPVAQCLAVAALVVPWIDRRHEAAQSDDELTGRQTAGDRQQDLTDRRDLRLREPGQMVGEHPHRGPVDVAREERRVHLRKVVHDLLGEVALPVGRPPRPRERGAHLVRSMRDGAVEPVDGAVVEGGRGPPDLGDHSEQPGGLMTGLPGLRDQERQQIVVGYPGNIDPGEGGGQQRAGSHACQARHVLHHRHASNIHSRTDSFRRSGSDDGLVIPGDVLVARPHRSGRSASTNRAVCRPASWCSPGPVRQAAFLASPA